MRLSTLLGKTLRQPPSDAHLPSHQLLVRAGFVRALEAGQFAYLPLGFRSLHRLQRLLRYQLGLLGGHELRIPSLPEAESEAALVRLIGREVDSYRQLPVMLFWTTTLAVPETSHRLGLFGAGDRPAIEIWVLGPDTLTEVESRITSALDRAFAACDLEVVWADAGDEGHQAFMGHPSGDEELVRCSLCDYAAARSWATTSWAEPPAETELPMEEVATPGCDTIVALSDYLGIPATKTLKMVFYSVEGKVTCAVVRGDRLIDETKLARVLGTDWYYVSLEEELAAIGAVGGYASPIGLDASRVRVVADPSVRSGANFVSGANRPDYHILNVNVPRDFEPGDWADVALIVTGDPCPRCGEALEVQQGFALARSTAPRRLKAEYLDERGRAQPLWLASWRLDVARLLAGVVDTHHDEHGILWPVSCAPFDVHVVALDLRQEAVAEHARTLVRRLEDKGFSVLFDDRDASAGVKFNDADLIGVPLRLTVSKRSAADGLIEAKWRDSRDRLKLDEDVLEEELARLQTSG